MVDHLSLGVRDLDAAARFYDAVFAPLGHAKTWAQEREIAYGRGDTRLVRRGCPQRGRAVRGQPRRLRCCSHAPCRLRRRRTAGARRAPSRAV